jgi:hypothetical protein
MVGSNKGLTCLNFFLKGLVPDLSGILCCMMLVSYVFSSSYFQENNSTYSLNNFKYSSLFLVDISLDNFMNFASYFVPMFHSSTLSYLGMAVGFMGT